MWKMLSLVLTLLIFSTVMPPSIGRSNEEIRREYVDKFQRVIDEYGSEAVPVQRSSAGPPKDFTCYTAKPEWYTPATDVHRLTPWDISIIGAMGDSVTAAMGAGASTIFGDLKEYRWLSWSIGGDKDIREVSTLPNIIREYNPDVQGFSIEGNAGLNVAVTGAVAEQMESEAVDLVERMNQYEEVDERWKVITLWIGGNDLCAACSGDPEELGEQYASRVQRSLDYLSRNVKRAYVNLVDMIDITQLMLLKGVLCSIIHPSVCSCATREDNKPRVIETVKQYNIYLRKMLALNNYYDREDFTVVIQPFFSDTLVPTDDNGQGDKSYFAPDCFHFSTKGHGVGALYLWNNMLEKNGEKTNYIDWKNLQDYKCISDENRYFSINVTTSSLRSGKSNDHSDSSDTHLVPSLVGVACGVVVIAVMAIVITLILYKMKKSSRADGEQVKLIPVKV